MPNDPPYGGSIKVNKNGSVTWTVSAREYPSYRDVDGTVEYAIRVVDKDRTIITSRDGKCILRVHLDEAECKDHSGHTEDEMREATSKTSKGTPVESEKTEHLRFLIVTGYDMPAAPENTTIVGKSYFVTMNGFPSFKDGDKQPEYDLILQYDDYDLERAGLPRNLEPTDLHVCHENWIAVDDLWKVFMKDPKAALSLITAPHDAIQKNVDAVQMLFQMDLESLAIWAAVERLLRNAGVTGDLQDILEMFVKSAKEKRIALTERGAVDPGTSEHTENNPHSTLVLVNETPVGTRIPPVEPDHFWVSRWHEVVVADASSEACVPEVLSSDTLALASAAIDRRLIRGQQPVRTPGSRAITVKGIRGNGLYVLMYHSSSEKHSGSDH